MTPEELAALGPQRRREILGRTAGVDAIREDVDVIVDRVREAGDEALREYTETFDDVTLGALEITDRLERAPEEVDEDVLAAIEEAVGNVRAFHEAQRPASLSLERDGYDLERRFSPIERVGAYVPGGTAAYPSSAIMTVVPARIAGVDEIVVTTPPGEPVHPVTLAALAVAGADRVFRLGGAQAVAAMAYGTGTVPRVHKIVGPGNAWVTAAKLAVQGDTAIDFPAGPSELVVIADGTAEPSYVAADLAAQAEHGPSSPVVLLTDDADLADHVCSELGALIERQSRGEIIEAAIDQPASACLVVRSLSEAISFAQEYAPEHLSVQTAEDDVIVDRVECAGSVFVGGMTPVAAGDYASGTNHVLPTNGLAKVTGGLSVDSFLRSRTIQRFTSDGLTALAPTIERLAEVEGLTAHADSVRIRVTDEESGERHS